MQEEEAMKEAEKERKNWTGRTVENILGAVAEEIDPLAFLTQSSVRDA